MSTAMISKAPLRQVKDVRELLSNENARNQLASVAAKHMNPERMMRVVANAIRTTPKLQEADPLSMLGALMNCAAMGLEPNTQLGHAYLVPFENKRKGIVEVQVIIGYKGYIDLARRSGSLVSIHADVVYEDDEHFSHEYGSNQHLKHVPGPRKGAKAGAYCHIKVKSGDLTGEGHVYLPGDEILGVRDKSQGWNSAKRFGKTADSPWMAHEDRMWAKTAVRRLANSGELPMSIEFMQAMEVDDTRVDFAAYALNPGDGVVIEGEAEDAGDGEVVEQKPAAKQVEKPKPETKIADRTVAQEIEPGYDIDERPAQADAKAERAPEAKPAAAKPDAQALVAIAAQVVKDIEESGMPDAILEYHAAGLQRLEAEAPHLHTDVMKVVAEYESRAAAG